ncbi:MAG: two-component regulator propeller domain-containing protein [Paludibacter sp.]|nr:two-component regulator propeller domain-containing protein [Paludibacter sp.]
MWFGTRNGLNRYDGNTFTVFKHNTFSKQLSISDNQINCLVEDNYHALWIGTADGLNRMDLKNEEITIYKSEDNVGLLNDGILSLLFDRQKRLLVGTKTGLNIFLSNTKRFEAVNWNGKSKYLSISSLYQTHSGEILIGTTTKGLFVCDKDFRVLNHFDSNSFQPLAGNNITALFEDSKNQIWVGVYEKGLSKLNLDNQEVINFNPTNSGLSSKNIRSIVQRGNNILLGTSDGLNIVDLSSNTISKINYNFGQSNGWLSHPSVFSTFVDKVGTLWVGTYSGGISFDNQFNNRFKYYDLTYGKNAFVGIFGAMAYQPDDKLWIASEGGGLLELNLNTKEFNNYLVEKNATWEYSKNIIKSLYIENNIIWCGAFKGRVYKFDSNTKKFTLAYRLAPNATIYKIYRDLSSNLWICTSSDSAGLYKVTSRTIENSFPIQGGKYIHFPNVRTFKEIRKNVYLIGTRNAGLILYDTNKKSILKYNMNQKSNRQIYNNYITSIIRKKNGEIWVGSYGGGIFLFKETVGVLKKITTEQGLIEDIVCDIVESNDGNLWVSTNNGLSEFNTETGKIKNFDQGNGIYVREFSPHGGVKLPSGDICFSGSNGIISFNPTQLNKNPNIPEVVLRSLFINNKIVEPNDSSLILKNTIDNSDKIILKYNQNNISITYAALNYIFPEQNQYAYRLIGHDDNWNRVENRKEAYYTNLSPGKYIFQVIASNNDGKWNNSGKSIEIIIQPPIWARWYAYLFYFLLFVTIVGTIIFYVVKEKQLEDNLQKKQFEQQKLEEFHQAKVRLFTNFSHDLRTPLTLIITPLEDILRRIDINASVRASIQMIYNNAQRLLLLVNQLMDLRKNQSGNMKLKVTQQDLCLFLNEIYCVFNQIAVIRNIEFTFTHDSDAIDAWFDKNLLEKVVFNILSNAFKFTEGDGKITIDLKRITPIELKKLNSNGMFTIKDSAYYVCLSISDTGKGISPSEIEYIFTPFYQAQHNDDEHVIGTGIGLSLALSIVRLHYGMMWVEPNLPKGSIFKVAIPINKDAFNDSEIIENNVIEQQDKIKMDGADEKLLPVVNSLDKPTVLLVEDNDEVRTYFKEQLIPFFNIIESNNGADGFDKVIEFFPDVVVTDVMMPKVDGLQLCKLIKNDLNTGHIPVILLTARSMVMHVKEGFEFGADDYLIKPFNMQVLVVRIRNLLLIRKNLKTLYGKRGDINGVSIENTSSDERFTQKFFRIIEENASNTDLDINFICEKIGMSRANMYRKLKAITELTPTELIRNKRFEIAAQLLIDTEMNVAEVATATGFNSYEHFSRGFKKTYGLSPTDFIHKKRSKGVN